MWPVVTVHDHLIREGHDPTFACIGQEISSGQSTRFRRACSHACMVAALVRHPRARGNPVVVRNRPQFGTEGCTGALGNAPGMHANRHGVCTRGAFRRRLGPRQDRPPAIELRHSRACGNPAVVRNRPQFGTERCTGALGNAPQLPSNVRSLCIHLCTNCTPQHPTTEPPGA